MSDVRPSSAPTRVIHDAQRGDQAAFDTIFRIHQPGLLRYLRAVAPDLAADVASATWESVARSLHRFSGDGDDLRAWLFTIARRRLTDEVRRASRRPLRVASPPEDVDERTAADAAWGEPDWAEAVLRKIPTRQADAVALRVIGGLSVAETADLLGVTQQNVRVLCHRGLGAIAEVLGVDRAGTRSENAETLLSVV
ncbi:MAG: sigma-70 family RNA polymerase sigma factor [Acidimicrobiales bacterium]|nr:sigma-70 family RNA polymerase sigma factor [Acidimicrobiales bacterium]